VERRERALEAVLVHESRNIPELDSGVFEEAAVWTALVGVHGPFEHVEEALAATLELRANSSPAFLVAHRRAEETAQSRNVAGERSQVVQHAEVNLARPIRPNGEVFAGGCPLTEGSKPAR
jgi:hypothetical protein